MADDERRRLLKRIEKLEEASAAIQRELARVKDAVEGLTEEPSGQPTREHEPAFSERAAEPALKRGPEDEEAAADTEPGAGSDRDETMDLEVWLGGRGLLLIGVVALVFAVGLLFKYALDRGWIGPLFRVLLGGGVGIAAVVIGDRLRDKGYRVYGLWLAAGGFGAIYLSIWAAVALYSLLPTVVGFALVIVVISATAVMGISNDSEALVGLAAFGGYLAPLLIELQAPSNLFGLAYLAAISSAGLWIAQRQAWRYLAALVVIAGTLMAIPSAGDPDLHSIYLIALSAAAFMVARRRHWPVIALLTVIFGWGSLAIGRDDWSLSGLKMIIYSGGLWLVSLLAWLGITDWTTEETRTGVEAGSESDQSDARTDEMMGAIISVAPPFLFYLYALWALDGSVPPDWERGLGFLIGMVLGAVYILMAIVAPQGRGPASRSWRWSIGFAAWLGAPAVMWTDMALARAWLVEGVALTAAGVVLGIVEARVAGLVGFVFAALVYAEISNRTHEGPAFVGFFALTGLGAALGPAAWALGLRRVPEPAPFELGIQQILIFASGLLFLYWGTGEITVFYDHLGEARDWRLARDLTISAFWIAYAALLLIAGFVMHLQPLRWAGLIMALISAGKVFLYDLSQLSQLYRVASFFGLAVTLLALAFLYQKLRSHDLAEKRTPS